MTHLGFAQRSLRKKIAENAKGFYTFLCVLCDYFADFCRPDILSEINDAACRRAAAWNIFPNIQTESAPFARICHS